MLVSPSTSLRIHVASLVVVMGIGAAACGKSDSQMTEICEHQFSLSYHGPGRGAKQGFVAACVVSGEQMINELSDEEWAELKACLLASTTKAEYSACSTAEQKIASGLSPDLSDSPDRK